MKRLIYNKSLRLTDFYLIFHHTSFVNLTGMSEVYQEILREMFSFCRRFNLGSDTEAAFSFIKINVILRENELAPISRKKHPVTGVQLRIFKGSVLIQKKAH